MAGVTKPSGERVLCEEEDCNKSYANKYNMKDHMKKTHQSVVQSIVTSVVDFLSPHRNKDAFSNIDVSSPKELFVDNEEDTDALNEAGDDLEIIQTGVRHEQIELLKIPIVPEKGWLTNTMPAGELSKALGQLQNRSQTSEAPAASLKKSLTCVECHVGRETNREQDRKLKSQSIKLKAETKAHKDLQKWYKQQDENLTQCRQLLDNKTKECVVLQKKLETIQQSNELIVTENAEVVEEVVCSAGDWKTCDMCQIKVKGVLRLIKHQQADHFTCTMCPKSHKWIGLSMDHLKIHQTNTHKVVHSKTLPHCTPCKTKFPDAMSLNVHKLKNHSQQFKCGKCSEAFSDKNLHEDHIKRKHGEIKKIKCIVCEHTTDNEAELTKHYEQNHINGDEISVVGNKNKPKDQIKCKNGPTCRFLKADRCSFLHEEVDRQQHSRGAKSTSHVQSRREVLPSRETQRRGKGESVREDQLRRSNQSWREEHPRMEAQPWREDRSRMEYEDRRPSQPWRQVQNRREPQPWREVQNRREAQPWREVQNRREAQPWRETQVRRDGQRSSPNYMTKQCKFGSRCDKGVFCTYLHLAKDFLSLPAERRR